MGLEIERKFLVKSDSWRAGAKGKKYCQGYVYAETGVVRIRIAGDNAFITIKGENTGAVRKEFEYPIPTADATELLDIICSKPYITKTRYEIEYAGKLWEIDEFGGDNFGLIVAEIELESEDEAFELPDWAGEEVTSDPRYYNSSLATHPYKNWKK